MARKILLADDSVTAQNMGRRILSDAGYEVTTVNNGSAALKRIAESKPDLIVLDVYMPGYGGLEVCQRLRESDDTARIPVLLTVGKLEPFKVEEVRRVRADAFIVKPFEASELLSALTKLEDKIVPVAQPRKPGRQPKPGTSVDDFMGTAREYGDTETGWKNRLRIPPPHRKAQPEFPEPEPERARDVQPRQEQKREKAPPEPQLKEVRPKEVQAKDVPAKKEKAAASLPADITMEEIAAIQAAAAAFTMPVESAAKPKIEMEEPAEPSPEVSTEKLIAALEVAAAQPGAESRAEMASVPAEAATVPPADAPAPPAEMAVASQPDQPAEFPVSAEAVAAPEISSPALEQPSTDQNKLAEHEVAAVLASLEFVNGTSGSSGADAEPDEPFFATIAAAPAREEVAGPRWVAQLVPVAEDESALILEQEMQKAMAAMAELNAAEAASANTGSAVAAENVEPAVQAAPNDGFETKPEETPFAPVAIPVAEQPASSEPADAVASPVVMEPVVERVEAAYAAAASTGSAGETTVSMEAASPALAPEPMPAAEATEPQRDSELASAWASWKQIRESVVSPQMASQIAEAVVPAASTSVETSVETSMVESASVEPTSVEAAPQQPSASAAEPETHAAGEESEAIASIVDTVLSELKPKLMQEIAKKMGKEKKK